MNTKINPSKFHIMSLLLLFVLSIGLTGCFGGRQRAVTNYYVLDYNKATENPNLKMTRSFPHTLEIVETTIPRTYNRNQIVVKEQFSKIRYLQNDLWAIRLYDAVPNVMVERFKAYNIFQRVDRDLGEINPTYTLETNISNIEMIESDVPLAFLRMSFSLRERTTQKIVLSYQNESTKKMYDTSIVYLIQALNELIMAETDVF
ncbi:MAG: ABC-type transport auxiliary lipoprotein family protein, partial [Candidatus Cloacimonadaceae bacterium]|nr:ABC-type transport auxiliary lipoprotein family protein [Candidatus Cloacimonadaceae bacterium]